MMSDHDTDSEYSSCRESEESWPHQPSLDTDQDLRKSETVMPLGNGDAPVDETASRDEPRTQLASIVKSVEAKANQREKNAEDVTAREHVSSSGNTHSGNPRNNAIASDSIRGRDDAQKCEVQRNVGGERESSENDVSFGPKIFFRLATGDWESFTERLDLHFFVRKISEADMKRAILLTHVDEETYKLFKNLCAPDKPATKSYDDLIKLFPGYLEPPIAEMTRLRFNRATQEQNETIADFSKRLRDLALGCNFALDQLSQVLHNQFVCGISDTTVRVKLFKRSNLTFYSALKQAIARERPMMKDKAGAHEPLAPRNFNRENFALDRHARQHELHKDTRSGTSTTGTFSFGISTTTRASSFGQSSVATTSVFTAPSTTTTLKYEVPPATARSECGIPSMTAPPAVETSSTTTTPDYETSSTTAIPSFVTPSTTTTSAFSTASTIGTSLFDNLCATSTPPNAFTLTIKKNSVHPFPTIAEDVLAAELGGQWIFSCYAPSNVRSCIPEMTDLSPEEYHWEMYQAQRNGSIEQVKRKFRNLRDDRRAILELLKNPTRKIVTMLNTL